MDDGKNNNKDSSGGGGDETAAAAAAALGNKDVVTVDVSTQMRLIKETLWSNLGVLCENLHLQSLYPYMCQVYLR